MVKVKMLVSRSGPASTVAPGDEIEVSAAEAVRMFAAGQIDRPKGKEFETAAKAHASAERAAVTRSPADGWESLAAAAEADAPADQADWIEDK